MQLFNSLTQKKEEFIPLHDKKVGLYSCGPTVYNVAHVGNLRAYLATDLLKRVLASSKFQVRHVMNITDVDDKTIKSSDGKLEEFKKQTKKFENQLWQDFVELNLGMPDVITRATEYIEEMVAFIEDLLGKGYAYRSEDGSIYFSINKFKDYGKLSNLDKRELRVGARVSQDAYDKENPTDFALWKAWDEQDGEIFWETALGKGRPGWHIECSAMSSSVLGDTIDIHTGGIDLLFPHHENEIAQSEARSGKKFVNYWLHNEHVMVNGVKMSKSLHNFFSLKDVKDKGFDPLDFRYLALGAHYRSKLNFTWESLEAAKNARARLNRILGELPKSGTQVETEYLGRFYDRLSDDLDSPGALSVLWELVRDENVSSDLKAATILEMDKSLGLKLGQQKIEIPAQIIEIAEERKLAREKKDFSQSDLLRDKLAGLGWEIEDKAQNSYKLIRK